MDDIALRHGVSLNQLVNLNSTKTLPPKGSYLQITPSMSSLINQGIPASAAAQIVNSRPKTNTGGGRGDDFYGRHSNEIKTASQVMQQLASGQMPNTIPLGALPFIKNKNGQPLTTQTAIQMGYVLNSNGVLVNRNSPAAATAGAGGGIQPPSADFMATQAYRINYVDNQIPFLNQLRYDPQTKKYKPIKWFLKTGKLDIRTGRAKKGNIHKHRGSGRSYTPAPVTTVPTITTTEGPQTILDLHLGSG
jgi:hypothetical protein